MLEVSCSAPSLENLSAANLVCGPGAAAGARARGEGAIGEDGQAIDSKSIFTYLKSWCVHDRWLKTLIFGGGGAKQGGGTTSKPSAVCLLQVLQALVDCAAWPVLPGGHVRQAHVAWHQERALRLHLLAVADAPILRHAVRDLTSLARTRLSEIRCHALSCSRSLWCVALLRPVCLCRRSLLLLFTVWHVCISFDSAPISEIALLTRARRHTGRWLVIQECPLTHIQECAHTHTRMRRYTQHVHISCAHSLTCTNTLVLSFRSGVGVGTSVGGGGGMIAGGWGSWQAFCSAHKADYKAVCGGGGGEVAVLSDGAHDDLEGGVDGGGVDGGARASGCGHNRVASGCGHTSACLRPCVHSVHTVHLCSHTSPSSLCSPHPSASSTRRHLESVQKLFCGAAEAVEHATPAAAEEAIGCLVAMLGRNAVALDACAQEEGKEPHFATALQADFATALARLVVQGYLSASTCVFASACMCMCVRLLLPLHVCVRVRVRVHVCKCVCVL